eukprot:278225-Pyramimonas_sp.AAC.1
MGRYDEHGTKILGRRVFPFTAPTTFRSCVHCSTLSFGNLERITAKPCSLYQILGNCGHKVYISGSKTSRPIAAQVRWRVASDTFSIAGNKPCFSRGAAKRCGALGTYDVPSHSGTFTGFVQTRTARVFFEGSESTDLSGEHLHDAQMKPLMYVHQQMCC